jgi:hypothetical protein
MVVMLSKNIVAINTLQQRDQMKKLACLYRKKIRFYYRNDLAFEGSLREISKLKPE